MENSWAAATVARANPTEISNENRGEVFVNLAKHKTPVTFT
jgi:hypothetical protein